LEYARATRLDGLTRAQLRLVAAAPLARGSLLDVGCGTGKFLYHARAYFGRVAGVEVSEASVQFATKELGLEVLSKVALTPGPFDVITSWHALEHIPGPALTGLVRDLRARCHENTKVIVCVPNPDSLLARLLGRRWAFRDIESHLHEFSRRSLDELLRQAGFRPECNYRIFAYTFFTWVQSLANLGPLPHNYFYYRLKRGWSFNWSRARLLAGDTLAVICLLPAIVVGSPCALAEHALSRARSVHAVAYHPVVGP